MDHGLTSRAFTEQALVHYPKAYKTLQNTFFWSQYDRSRVLTSLHQLSLAAEDLGKGGGSTGESVLHGWDVPLGLMGQSLNDTPRRKAPVCLHFPLKTAAGATLQLCKNSRGFCSGRREIASLTGKIMRECVCVRQGE